MSIKEGKASEDKQVQILKLLEEEKRMFVDVYKKWLDISKNARKTISPLELMHGMLHISYIKYVK
jgi:hypothetical protein